MPGPRVSHSPIRVRYAETDAQGVVYYANYLIWFEVGRVDFLRQAGVDYAELEARGQGVMIVEANCRYQAPARFNDELIVHTWCDELRHSSFRFRYEVRRGEVTLAEGYTIQVFLDLKEGKSTRVPPEMREILIPSSGRADQS